MSYGEEFEKYVFNKLINRGFLVVNNIILHIDTKITQIDHIVILDDKLYVLECKDLRCSLESYFLEDTFWVLNYNGKRIPYYNPVIQNSNHCKELEKLFPDMSIINIVIFNSYCKFKENYRLMYLPTFLDKLNKENTIVSNKALQIQKRLKALKMQNMFLQEQLINNISDRKFK